MFDICKDSYPKEATIECIENRVPGIDLRIMATPCDGIMECRDGIDENFEEDKWILAATIFGVLLATMCIYLYLVLVRLPLWKKSVLMDFDDGDDNIQLWHSDCSKLTGNTLAKLKVFQLKNMYLIARC